MSHNNLILAITAAIALSVAASPAAAAPVPSQVVVIDLGPVVCHPIHCVQHRTKTIYRHGSQPETLTQVRSRVAESRTPYHSAPPWSRWHTLSVAFG